MIANQRRKIFNHGTALCFFCCCDPLHNFSIWFSVPIKLLCLIIFLCYFLVDLPVQFSVDSDQCLIWCFTIKTAPTNIVTLQHKPWTAEAYLERNSCKKHQRMIIAKVICGFVIFKLSVALFETQKQLKFRKLDVIQGCKYVLLQNCFESQLSCGLR